MRLFLIKSVTVGLGLACLVQLPGDDHPPLPDNEVILSFVPPSIDIKVLANGEIEVSPNISSIDKKKVLGWLDDPGAKDAWKDDEGQSIIHEVKVATDGQLNFSCVNGTCKTNNDLKTLDYAGRDQNDEYYQATPRKPVNSQIKYSPSLDLKEIKNLELVALTKKQDAIRPIEIGHEYAQDEVIYAIECSAESIGSENKWSHVVHKVYFINNPKGGAIFLGVNGRWKPEKMRAPGDDEEEVSRLEGRVRPGVYRKPKPPDDEFFWYHHACIFVPEKDLASPSYSGPEDGQYMPWGDYYQRAGFVTCLPDHPFLSGGDMQSIADHTTEWEIKRGDFTPDIAKKLKAYLDVMKKSDNLLSP